MKGKESATRLGKNSLGLFVGHIFDVLDIDGEYGGISTSDTLRAVTEVAYKYVRTEVGESGKLFLFARRDSNGDSGKLCNFECDRSLEKWQRLRWWP